MTVQTIGISSVVSPDSPPLSLFNYIRNWRTTSPPTFFSCIFSFSWYIWWLCFCSHYLSLDIFIPVSFVSSFQISLPSPFASRPTPLLPSVYLPQLRWRRRCWICKLSSQHIYLLTREWGSLENRRLHKLKSLQQRLMGKIKLFSETQHKHRVYTPNILTRENENWMAPKTSSKELCWRRLLLARLFQNNSSAEQKTYQWKTLSAR